MCFHKPRKFPALLSWKIPPALWYQFKVIYADEEVEVILVVDTPSIVGVLTDQKHFAWNRLVKGS